MKKLLAVCFLTLASLGAFACVSPASSKGPAVENFCNILHYGNGVYYFACTKDEFGKRLARFIAESPDKEYVSSTGDGDHRHGHDRGYFVVFRDRQK